MRKTLVKSALLRLDAASYRKLHRLVLQRDGWRCQGCGKMRHLEVHHLQLRSHGGNDLEANLVTLCVECHGRVHRKDKV